MEIAVIGQEDFCLGFRLTGIKKVWEVENPKEAIEEARLDQDLGIVILDEKLYEQLDEFGKEELEDSIRPIYITLSTRASEDWVKRILVRTLGVEL